MRSNDRVLNIRIFDHITNKDQVFYNDIPCFAYRISDTNLSNRYEDMLALMLPVAHKYSEGKDKTILLSNIYYTLGMQGIRNGDKKIALQYFKKSLHFHKNIKKICVMILLLIMPHVVIQSHIIQRNIQKFYAMFT